MAVKKLKVKDVQDTISYGNDGYDYEKISDEEEVVYDRKAMKAANALHRYFEKNQAGTILLHRKVESLLAQIGNELPTEEIINILNYKWGYTVLAPSVSMRPPSMKNKAVPRATVRNDQKLNVGYQAHDNQMREISLFGRKKTGGGDNVKRQLQQISDEDAKLQKSKRRLGDRIKSDSEKLKAKREDKRGLMDKLKDNKEKRGQIRSSKTENNDMRITKTRLVEVITEEVFSIMEKENWMKDAVKRPGAVRKRLGAEKGEKIPVAKLNKDISRLKKKGEGDKKMSATDRRELRQDVLAKTFKGMNEEESYQKFFQSKLKGRGISSPSQLKGEEKKKFFDEIDAEWKSDAEKLGGESEDRIGKDSYPLDAG